MATDFGTDISCVTDLAADGHTVSGQRLVGEAVVRRWSTPRGGLLDDPDYGFSIIDYLNDDMSPADLAALQAGAEAEALKDTRVQSASVVATLAKGTGTLQIVAELVTALGPFTLTVAVSAVTIDLLSVN